VYFEETINKVTPLKIRANGTLSFKQNPATRNYSKPNQMARKTSRDLFNSFDWSDSE
jgi:hypothetical protein